MSIENLVSQLEADGAVFRLRYIHEDGSATVRIRWGPNLQDNGPQKIAGHEDDLVNFIAEREWLRLWEPPAGSSVD